jgi:hypothetical protein
MVLNALLLAYVSHNLFLVSVFMVFNAGTAAEILSEAGLPV